MRVTSVIMRILYILFKSILLFHSQPPLPYGKKDKEISYESPVWYVRSSGTSVEATVRVWKPLYIETTKFTTPIPNLLNDHYLTK